MPSPTYVALAKATATGTETVITFSAIPQTYTDLILLISARSASNGSTAAQVNIRPNGNSANMTSRVLYGDGSTVSSFATSSVNTEIGYVSGSTATSNTFGSAEIYFPNYTSNVTKPISGTGVAETNAVATSTEIAAALYNQTTAITSIEVRIDTGAVAIASGSRFDLYGIKNS